MVLSSKTRSNKHVLVVFLPELLFSSSILKICCHCLFVSCIPSEKTAVYLVVSPLFIFAASTFKISLCLGFQFQYEWVLYLSFWGVVGHCECLQSELENPHPHLFRWCFLAPRVAPAAVSPRARFGGSIPTRLPARAPSLVHPLSCTLFRAVTGRKLNRLTGV